MAQDGMGAQALHGKRGLRGRAFHGQALTEQAQLHRGDRIVLPGSPGRTGEQARQEPRVGQGFDQRAVHPSRPAGCRDGREDLPADLPGLLEQAMLLVGKVEGGRHESRIPRPLTAGLRCLPWTRPRTGTRGTRP